MISLSNEKHLKLVLRNVGWRFVILSFLRTKDINRIRSLHNIATYLIKLRKNHGDMYVIKFLKASQLAVQKKLAGSPFESLRELEPDLPLPRLSRSGLPYLIKLSDRSAIVRGSVKVIRFWLSILSLYRVLKGEIKPKLNTITDPFTGDQKVVDDFQRFLWLNSRRLLRSFLPSFDRSQLASNRLIPILKASPSSKVSIKGYLLDIKLLRESNIWPSFRKYLMLTRSKGLSKLVNSLELIQGPLISEADFKGNNLGQLSFKEEAAGKLRVFAMVDVITQSLLKPLHDTLFGIFKLLPNDGTHDQELAFTKAQTLAKKYGSVYGYDLSSATDRLPVSVQSYFLSTLFGADIGRYWQDILVGRSYVILKNSYGLPEGNISYRVGQPMGALSSWAMLNMIHHMMVQYCAWQAFGYQHSWYKDYLVLGDDIVIFDKKISQRYLDLCSGLGVSINISKSVISEKSETIEFAKRTSYKGHDVSGLSFREFISNNNFFGRLAVTSKILRRSWGDHPVTMFVLGSLESNTKVRLTLPIIGYLTNLVDRGQLRLEQLVSLLVDSSKPLSYFGRKLDAFDKKPTIDMFKNMLKGSRLLTVSMRNLWFSSTKLQEYKIALFEESKNTFNGISKFSDIRKFADQFSGKTGVVGLKTYEEMVFKPNQMNLMLLSNEFRWSNFPDYYDSKQFNQKDLDYYLDLLKRVQSLKQSFKFYETPVERRKELDNTLKILKFIRDSRSSKIQALKPKSGKMVFPTNIFPMFLLGPKAVSK